MKATILALLLTLFVSTQAQAWKRISDFEGGTVGEKANTHPSGSDGAYALTVFSDEKALSGNKSAKATVTKGSTGHLEWGVRYELPDLTEGDELWYRAWLYFPSDFVYNPDHGAKGLRVRVYSNSGSSEGYYNIYPNASGITIHQGVDGPAFSDNNANKKFSPALKNWEALEIYIKFSATPGKGIYRVWRNGNLLFEDKKTKTLGASNSKAKEAFIFRLWSNYDSPVTQSNYIDDVILTNEQPSTRDAYGNPFIGTGDIEILAAPKPPIIIGTSL